MLWNWSGWKARSMPRFLVCFVSDGVHYGPPYILFIPIRPRMLQPYLPLMYLHVMYHIPVQGSLSRLEPWQRLFLSLLRNAVYR